MLRSADEQDVGSSRATAVASVFRRPAAPGVSLVSNLPWLSWSRFERMHRPGVPDAAGPEMRAPWFGHRRLILGVECEVLVNEAGASASW